MKSNITEFKEAKDRTYVSLIDEFRRFKYFRYHKHILADSEKTFALLQKTLKYLFKIKRELIPGMEFGLNVKNTFTMYTLDTLDIDKKTIILTWFVEKDEYKLELEIAKPLFSKNKKSVFKARQQIHREVTFFGLSDYIGVIVYKKAFRSNMKTFAKYMKHLIDTEADDKTKVVQPK